MTESELTTRLKNVFADYDPYTIVEVHGLSKLAFWGKVVSSMWDHMTIPERSYIADELLAARDPNLREQVKLVIIALSPRECTEI